MVSLRDYKIQESLPLYWVGGSTMPADYKSNRKTQHKNVMGFTGISANTRIETMRGTTAAKDLKVGDQINVKSGGFSELRWIGTSRLNPKGGVPFRKVDETGREGSTLLAPEHLVLVQHEKNQHLFGADEVLCPVSFLAPYGLYKADSGVSPSFVHLLFDSYELVQLGNEWVESLLPDMDTIKQTDMSIANDIIQSIPGLANSHGLASYMQNYVILDQRETRLLFG